MPDYGGELTGPNPGSGVTQMKMARKAVVATGVLGTALLLAVVALGQTAPRVGNVDQRAAGMFENALVPIGAVIPFFGDPSTLQELGGSWQLCDGAPLSANADPRLRAALADKGDAASARVPQLAKQVLYGVGDGVTLNAPFGASKHSHGMDHNHDVDGFDVKDVALEGSTGDASLRDTSGQMGRPGSWNGEAGKFVSHATEDTLSVKLSGHRHSASVKGTVKIPKHKTAASSSQTTTDSEHYPPGIGAYFIMRIR